MVKKTVWRTLLGMILLSLAISAVICCRTDRHEILSSTRPISRDGFLYGMDITDDQYHLFCTDESTGYSRSVRVPRIMEGTAVTISNLTVGQDGQVYFYCKKDGAKKERWIGTWDLAAERIKKVWDLEEAVGMDLWLMTASKGELLMETYGEDGNVYEWVLDQAGMRWQPGGCYAITSYTGGFLHEKGKQWRIDKFGNLYVQTTEMEEEACVFLNDGSQIGTSNCLFFLGDDGLHFLNLEEGKEYGVRYADGEGELFACEDQGAILRVQEQFGPVSELDKAEPEGFTGTTWLGQRQVPFVYGERSFILSRLCYSPKDQARRIFLLALRILPVLGGLCLVTLLVFKLNDGVIPLLYQMLLIGVPLFAAVCIGSSGQMDKVLIGRLLETEKDTLVQTAALYGSTLDPSDPILSPGYAGEMWENDAMIASGYHDMEDGQDKPGEDIYIIQSYACRDGEVYDLSGGSGPTVPIDYSYGKNICEAIRTVIEKDMPVSLIYQDENGNWLSVFVPYHGADGLVTAVIQMREDIQPRLYRIAQSVEVTARTIFSGFAVLAAVVSAIVWISLLPLGSLSRAVNEVARGKLDVRLKERLPFTEIGRIAQVFNQMSFNISRSMRELEEIGRKYAMFIPSQFLGYLGKETILETARGDHAEEDFVVMEIASADFGDVAGSITGQQTFETIVQALGRIVPVLEEKEGMVAGFSNAGALSVYKDGGPALTAAISVIQDINREHLKVGGTVLSYTAGLCFGPVRLGIIGAGHRSEAVAMSLNCQFAGMLQRMAVKYGACILLTGEAAKHIQDLETGYHYRILGYVWFSSKEVLDVIYDVFDADDVDIRQLKQRTKALFERGVQLFVGEEYLEARNCFVHVLYENRDDLAAQRYFSLCERYLNGTGEEEIHHYIEVF